MANQVKPLDEGYGKLWKNKFKTSAAEHKSKPDFTGFVRQQGESAERKVSMWVNKYDDGTTNIGLNIGDPKDTNSAPAAKQSQDDELPF